jgi:alkylation response protein AidB-like acyl-CoA dehydrogenase
MQQPQAQIQNPPPQTPLQLAASIAARLAQSAVARDRRGGTPKAERDLLRQSGLLGLSIPKEHGGLGGSWAETLMAVRILARADSSVAHLFAFHHLMLATVRLFGTKQQWSSLYQQTVASAWFWGNALNPLDARTISVPHDGWRDFTGRKSFCSGALDSDMLIASARQEGQDKLVIAALPTSREGITLFDDWDNIGQRQTDSGSAEFKQVRVEESEILSNPGPLGNVFATLRPLLGQAILSNIYLGIAEGAFEAARQYTLTESRRWMLSSADGPSNDPYVLERYGEFWLGLESARLLNDRALVSLDDAWRCDELLSESERGATAIAVATGKVCAAKIGLELTSRMFDVMGARSTQGALGLDRYWRNLRTHSLHDPLDYKARELGDWALNQRIPSPTFYS